MLDQFIVHELQNVFTMDALASSHQISINVKNPDEINDIFDKISYAKGIHTFSLIQCGIADYLFDFANS